LIPIRSHYWEGKNLSAQGVFGLALKQIDFELKESRDFKKNLKLFLFVYYHKNHFF